MAATFCVEKIAPGVIRAKWTGLTAGVYGDALVAPDYPDKTVQVLGTFSAQTVSIYGSNDGGTTKTKLTDSRGGANVLDFTAADGRTINENPLAIYPFVSNAGAPDITVIIIATAGK